MGVDPGRWSDQGQLVVAKIHRAAGHSWGSEEGREVPQLLVLRVARQMTSDALDHSEPFTTAFGSSTLYLAPLGLCGGHTRSRILKHQQKSWWLVAQWFPFTGAKLVAQ